MSLLPASPLTIHPDPLKAYVLGHPSLGREFLHANILVYLCDPSTQPRAWGSWCLLSDYLTRGCCFFYLPCRHRAMGDHGSRREPARPDRTLLWSGPASYLQPSRERPGPGHRGDPLTASPRGAPAPADAGPLLTPAATLPAAEQCGGQHACPGPVRQPAAPGRVYTARCGPAGTPRTCCCGQRPHGRAPAAAPAAGPAVCHSSQRCPHHQWASHHRLGPRAADAAHHWRGEV